MKKVLSNLIVFLSGLALFLALLEYVGLEKLEESFSAVSLPEIVVILLLGFLVRGVETLRWQAILGGQGYKFSFRELFGPSLACFSIYYLAPLAFLGADIFRAQAIKGKMPSEKRLASVLIDRLSTTLPVIVSGVIGLVVFCLRPTFPWAILKGIFSFPLCCWPGLVVFIFVSARKSLRTEAFSGSS
jgi:uncharacterized membrane protein YbhN (UPF0104 family)